ncbi:MAG: hypothetical protein RQ824_05675 [bacterium]|nr:hypothetical protein [bacterium]
MKTGAKLIPFVLLICSAFLLFSNTFLSTWTYDDFKLIVNNPDIRSLDLFIKNAQPGRVGREVSLMIDYYLFGLNPTGFHVQNILWHAVNAILLMILVGRLGGSRFVAMVSSFLFLIHPVQVEVVANVSHRKDSIALLFIFLSMLSYLEIFKGKYKKTYSFALAVLFFIMAIMTKENALMLPVIFIVYEALFIADKDRFILKYKRGLLSLILCASILAAAYFFFFYELDRYALTLQGHLGRQNYFAPDVFRAHYMLTLKSWSFMVMKLLLPLQLAVEYTLSVPDSWLDFWLFLTFFLLLSFLVILIKYKKRSAILTFSLLWGCLFFLPTSNILPLSYYAADRYLYTPSVGFCIMTGLLFDYVKFKTQYIKYGSISLLMFMMVLLTWKQNAVWRSPESLWLHSYNVTPSSTYALNNMGIISIQKGEINKAMDFFHKSIETNPSSSTAQYNLGYLYEVAGDIEKSRQHYVNFIRLNDPDFQKEVEKVRKKLGQR